MSASSADARILDRGYRPYDGPRLGADGRHPQPHDAHRPAGHGPAPAAPQQDPADAVGRHRLRAGHRLRRHRRARSPTIASATTSCPTYGEYYGFIISALIVFASFVAPEALCPDRRTGMLGLYLASPLTRDTYVLSKVSCRARCCWRSPRSGRRCSC